MKSLYATALLLLATAAPLSALDYYWVGGSGLWSDHNNHWATSSGGNVFHDQVPTSMDNVYFDINSFPAGGTVTIDQTIIYCMDMDWTGVTGTPTLTGPADKSMYIYGSLTLAAAMQFNHLGNVLFLAFQPGKTIRSNGQIFQGRAIFFGTNGEWSLQDDFRTELDLGIVEGVFHTNDHAVRVGLAFNLGSNCIVYLGASVISIYGGNSYTSNLYCQPANFHAGTSHFRMYGQGFLGGTSQVLPFYNVTFMDASKQGTFYNGSVANKLVFEGNGVTNLNVPFLHDAEFKKNGYFYSNSTFDRLHLSSGFTYYFIEGKTQTISPTGTLEASGTGCGEVVTLTTFSGQSTISKASGSVALDRVSLQNIIATGGAAFSATNSLDLGNNVGWSISPAASRELYWVGGGGDWNDMAHWSLTSGGAGGECLPSAYDNVYFDASSGFTPGQAVTVTAAEVKCKNMTWTGVQNYPVFQSNSTQNKLYLYGSLTFSAGMQNNFTGTWSFRATTPGNTITSAGQTMVARYITMEGNGGEWILQDNFTANSLYFDHFDGLLRTNNFTLTISGYSWSVRPEGKLILGSSDIILTGNDISAGLYCSPGNLDGGTAHFQFLQGGSFWSNPANNNTVFKVSFINPNKYGGVGGFRITDKLTFAGIGSVSSSTVHEAVFSKGGSLNDNNFFDILRFTPGFDYELRYGATQTIAANGIWQASGSGCNGLITIKSSQSGTKAIISKSGAAVALQYVRLMDLQASGGATFSAANSVDLGNNSGWIILSSLPRNLYWVGGGGNWSDLQHWSASSGGSSGECPPTTIDNVFFDAGSGFTTGQSVLIDPNFAYCKNMDWTGVLNAPTLTGGNYNTLLAVHGSLKFSPGMQNNYAGSIRFRATEAGQTITCAGNSFKYYVHFEGGGGEWILQDAFTTVQGINHTAGILRTNNQALMIGAGFQGSGGRLYFGSSVVTFLHYGQPVGDFKYAASGDFDAGTSDIRLPEGGIIYGNNRHSFYNISFLAPGNTGGLEEATVLGKVLFKGLGSLSGQYIHEAVFEKNGYLNGINGKITFDYLTFSPGSTYVLPSNTTVKITPLGDFNAQGTGGFPIEIKSANLGSQSTLYKDGDPICLDFLYLTGIAAAGTAFAYAGANSDNVSNNSGWKFEACPACFNAPPAPAPALDPASVTTVQPGGQATLILANLQANQEAVWFDAGQTIEIYASENNLFQPVINQPTTYYGAIRDLTTGCVSGVLPVTICPGPNIPLSITCPAGIPPLTANASCQALLGDYTGLATLSGGCNILLSPILQTPPPGTLLNPGTVYVTLSVSNTAGQSATCGFNVTISGGCGGH